MAFDLLHGKSAVGFIGGLLYDWLAVGGRYSFKGVVPGKLYNVQTSGQFRCLLQVRCRLDQDNAFSSKS